MLYLSLILNLTSSFVLSPFLLSVFLTYWWLETFVEVLMPQDKNNKNKQYSRLHLEDNIFLQTNSSSLVYAELILCRNMFNILLIVLAKVNVSSWQGWNWWFFGYKIFQMTSSKIHNWICTLFGFVKIVKLQPVFVALSEINRGTKSCCIYRNQILILSPYHFIETSLSASLAKKTNVFTVFGLLTCTIQNTAHATMSIWSKKDLAVLCCLSLHTVLKVIARRVYSLKGFDLLKWWVLIIGQIFSFDLILQHS